MRRLALALSLMALALQSQAGVYYVNKGVRYHIGDNHYSGSEDAVFMDAHPVVGPRWAQRFKVDRADKVRVRIDEVFGVDDCPYCKVMISIDGTPMARLYAENNRRGFTTPDVLAVAVEPGLTHELVIESIGGESVDDFVISGVVVETAVAEVELVGAPNISGIQEPLPPSEPACGGKTVEGLLDLEEPSLRLQAYSQPLSLPVRKELAPGERYEFQFRVLRVPDLDAVGQALEWRQGGEAWVLNWAPGRDQLLEANRRRAGKYRARTLDARAYRPGDWNSLEWSRCQDGTWILSLNGSALGSGQNLPSAPASLWIRGLSLELKPSGQ